MKMISWNIRGGGRQGFLAQRKNLIYKFNVDMLALMEILVNSNRVHKVIAIFNMHNVVEIFPEGFSGGIWLLWENSATFDVKVIRTNKRFIHCQMKDKIKSTLWFATFVYGYPHQHL